MSSWSRGKAAVIFLAGAAFFVSLSCKDYEFASPQPGILEIRLGVKNSRTDLLPFSPVNTFAILVRKVVVRKPGNIELEVFADLNAIRRNRDGDPFNCLDTLAADSALVLGKSYTPPGTYEGIDVEVTPVSGILVQSSFFPSFIEVQQSIPSPPALQQLPGPGKSVSITVQEGRLTRASITFDLDSSLVRRTETFGYRPYFYISSVQNF